MIFGQALKFFNRDDKSVSPIWRLTVRGVQCYLVAFGPKLYPVFR